MSVNSERAPYVYRAHPWLKGLACVTYLFVISASAVLVAFLHNLLYLAIPAVAAVVGAGWLLSLFRVRLRLWPDRWEFRGTFRTLSGRRLDVAGYRWHYFHTGDLMEFRLKSPDGAPTIATFTIPDYRDQPGFDDWIAGVPDLGSFERDTYESALEANTAFGETSWQRKQAIAQDRRKLAIVNWVAVIVALCVLFLPFTLPAIGLALCTLMPLLAIAAAALSRGRYAVSHSMGNPKLSLFVPASVPSLALAIRFLADTGTLDRWHVLLPAAVSAIVLTLIVGVIDGRLRSDMLGPTLLLAFAYSFGALLDCDHLADFRASTTYTLPLVDHYIAYEPSITGRYGMISRGVRHYILQLGPWGPQDSIDLLPRRIEVSASFYTALADKQLCMTLHQGALGWRWFNYRACPAR